VESFTYFRVVCDASGQGCDGSVLLDDTCTFTGEKTAGPNNRSVRGFRVVDDIKSKVEKVCPGVVSCADILAITARDSVVTVSSSYLCANLFKLYQPSFYLISLIETWLNFLQLGGPSWDVKLGRRDSKTASFNDANSGVIPAPTSTLSNLINRFQAKGLSEKDMVALSGTPLLSYLSLMATCVFRY
jgi:peroxidase